MSALRNVMRGRRPARFAWIRPWRAGFLALILFAGGSPAAVGQALPSSPAAISAMRAQLFHNDTGSWSADLFGPNPTLWNTVAKSNTTLIVIEVSAPQGDTYTSSSGVRTKYAVRLVAREKTPRPKVLLDPTQTIPALNEQRRAYLAYLLHPGGCHAVELSATLIGTKGKPFERLLPFKCGE